MMDGNFGTHAGTKGCLTIGGIIVAIILAIGIVLGFFVGWHWR